MAIAMAQAKILARRTIWPGILSSLIVSALACGGSQRVRPVERQATGALDQPATASSGAKPRHSVSESAKAAPSVNDPAAQDAETRLLQLLRAGQTLYVRQASRDGLACVAVQARPSVPDGSEGEVLLGGQLGGYAVHRGHWSVFRTGDNQTFAIGEDWTLHGVSGDGILVSGTLMSTSKEACVANLTYRPLALFHDQCGELRELSRQAKPGTTNTPWVFTRESALMPCRLAGAYFANGVRYPFQFFVPLGQAWVTGPLAGDGGQPRTVTFQAQAGHLKVGAVDLDAWPVVEALPPPEAEPAMVETGAHDFARDFLAEKRTLYIPLLHYPLWDRDPAWCAAVDLSKLHGKVILPTFSAWSRTLEFVKDEVGIDLWPADRMSATSDHGRHNLTETQCDSQHVHLAVHGRDASSYHVEGSRWFFHRAECERFQVQGRVLPSLVEIVNLVKEPCGTPDAKLVARPGVALHKGNYYVDEGAPPPCNTMQVSAPTSHGHGARQLVRRIGSPTEAERSFWLDDVAEGRFLWHHSERAFPFDATAGYLSEVLPAGTDARLSGILWLSDERSCIPTQYRIIPDTMNGN